MTKEEQLLSNRFIEYAELCYKREVPVYSDFLSLNEQTIFLSTASHFPPVRFRLTGGYEPAERKIACFLPVHQEDTRLEPPISALKVIPSNRKFAQPLTHRDYLGAVMNLGIQRSKIGDILITEYECYILCLKPMVSYLEENLLMVKHTKVERQIENCEHLSMEQRFEQVEGSVASVRLDSILALVYHSSRSKTASLIAAEKVFVNGKLITASDYHLKEGDIVSVRGLGKFIYSGINSQTKKGRYFISIKKYC